MYSELHRVARAILHAKRPDYFIQATALVNEVLIELLRTRSDWQDREHFFRTGARLLRRWFSSITSASREQPSARKASQVPLEGLLLPSPERFEETLLVYSGAREAFGLRREAGGAGRDGVLRRRSDSRRRGLRGVSEKTTDRHL